MIEEARDIATLIDALRPGNENWFDAARALRECGIPAIEPLIKALSTTELQDHAVVALSLFGKDAASAIPHVVPLLRDESRENLAADSAISMLEQLGELAVAPLVERLAHAADLEFARCRRILSRLDPNAATPPLLDCLASNNSLVRRRACQTLARIGSGSQDIVAPLVERLSDSDGDVRNTAAAALSNQWPQVLLDIFAKGDALTREGCTKALARCYSFKGFDAVEFFNRSLSAEEPFVRLAALEGFIRTSSHIIREGLEKELANENSDVKIESLRLTRQHGAVNSGISMSKARRLLHSDDVVVRREAACTIAAHGGELRFGGARLVADTLISALRDASDRNRTRYIASIRADISVKESLVPVLIDCLADSDREVAAAAALALGRVDAAGDEVIAGLIDALDTPHYELRENAVRALGMLGPAASAALPRLIAFLRDDFMIEEVLYAVETMGPAAASAVPDVVRIIGRRTEIAPYVLASIGTREAVLALCDSIDSYGHGDRKDFDASQGAMASIPDVAGPILKEEFERSKPSRYRLLLCGMAEALEPAELAPYLVRVLQAPDESGRRQALFVATHANVPAAFVKAAGAIDGLLAALDDEQISIRIYALEAFAACNEVSPGLAATHRDRLIASIQKSLRLAARESDEWDVKNIYRLAEQLGLSELDSPTG